LIKVY